MNGKSDADKATVDMLNGVIHGIKGEITGPCYAPGTVKEELAAKALPKFEGVFNFLGEKEFLVGDYVTWMDFYFFELLNFIQFLTDGELATRYPASVAYIQRVSELPGLKEYLASDKFVAKPFNGDMASVNNL